MSRLPAGTCPAHDVWDRVVLPCIRPAGHDGDHHAADLRELLPLADRDSSSPLAVTVTNAAGTTVRGVHFKPCKEKP